LIPKPPLCKDRSFPRGSIEEDSRELSLLLCEGEFGGLNGDGDEFGSGRHCGQSRTNLVRVIRRRAIEASWRYRGSIMVVGFDVVKLEGDFFGVGSFPWSFDHRMTIRGRRNEIPPYNTRTARTMNFFRNIHILITSPGSGQERNISMAASLSNSPT
jgi:hypothetical protein